MKSRVNEVQYIPSKVNELVIPIMDEIKNSNDSSNANQGSNNGKSNTKRSTGSIEVQYRKKLRQQCEKQLAHGAETCR